MRIFCGKINVENLSRRRYLAYKGATILAYHLTDETSKLRPEENEIIRIAWEAVERQERQPQNGENNYKSTARCRRMGMPSIRTITSIWRKRSSKSNSSLPIGISEEFSRRQNE